MSSDDDMPLSTVAAATKVVGNGANSTVKVKREYDSDSSDDMPLSRTKGAAKSMKSSSSSDSDSDTPLAQTTARANGGLKTSPPSSPDIPLAKIKDEPATPSRNGNTTRTKVKAEKGTRKRVKVENEKKKADKKPRITRTTSTASSKVSDKGKSEADNDDEEEDEEHKWWLAQDLDNSVKWTTLEHSGVLFPPSYQPHGIPLIYDGKRIKLEPDAEEVATFFAAMVDTDHAKNPIFVKNFFNDFLEVLTKCQPSHPVKEFEKCNFSLITKHLTKEKEIKSAMTSAEKKAIRDEKMKSEEMYMYCTLNGRKEKVGNFRIEPPGLFRGRGSHPKTGKLKKRVMPEQVTINIGEGAKIPDPPPGHSWGKIIHDNRVSWLATWKENVNDNIKYVFLAADSSLKGQSDLKKFEKARTLKGCIDQVRREYTRDLKDKTMIARQRATALYLIDRLALRAGNEKGDDVADTVGCCSLRLEHVTLKPPNIVHFDFLGKDSIRYVNEVPVDAAVFKNLRIFKKEPKTEADLLFDRLTTTSLNKHLDRLMKGLTAKVFRTFNASFTFQKQLENTPKDGTVAEKVLAYNRANRDVAILCNHQRSVSKAHETQMEKMQDKILEVKYKRMLLKEQLKEVDPEYVKKHPRACKKEDGVTKKWIKSYLISQAKKDKEKAEKKWEKDNEKLKEAGEPQIEKSQLKDTLKAIDERMAKIRSGEYEPGHPLKSATTERLLDAIKKQSQRLNSIETQAVDKEENKTTALGTSKQNYIDPRISAAWCKKHDVPIEKIFPKTLINKFKWALEVDKDWVF
ncbi:DNA topoisomerase 1 [Mycoemilia scoparia]|uniref:DNA topoisomerase I n=1 Tax=Mycoemilia scoparia TaxID=417184 RepID=A0A9W8ABC4_9FUNG|nr:DNA topoisomerase 1 [Mycoemilia scoparia]